MSRTRRRRSRCRARRRRARDRARRGSARARCSARRLARVMPAKTSRASPICGTHLGDTNADTSIARMARRRQRDRRTRSSRRSARSRLLFCRPSRGPTSTMVTWCGSVVITSLEVEEFHAGLHELAGLAVDRADHAIARRANRAAPSSSPRASAGCRPWHARARARRARLTTVAGIGAVSSLLRRASARAVASTRGAIRARARGRQPTPSDCRPGPATATVQCACRR